MGLACVDSISSMMHGEVEFMCQVFHVILWLFVVVLE